MVLIVGCVSQKGGVGKSTLARLLAREYAANDWKVKAADLDPGHATSYHWQSRRLQRAIEPTISIEQFNTVEKALAQADHYDLLILDGPPHSSAGTLKIAQASSLLLLPTGLTIDDLEPTVRLAHELVKNGIPRNRFVFVLCRAGERKPP
jgi:chromosome partitioning protein